MPQILRSIAFLALILGSHARAASSIPPSNVSVSNWKTSPSDPVSCRLTDGSSFYTASGGSGGGSGGAILDGVDSSVKATVTASKALKVDGSGVTQPVSGAFFQATQPVSIASMPSTPVTGTFWQSTQPVSGTFWQTTQPISASSLPLPSGASQEHTTAASPNACRLSDGAAFISTLPVSIASMPSTPVTGTFWQATQPVSIASMPSTPVTGTFWQATQPVSGTMTANAGSGTFAVSAASLPLPSGASTSAKQPAPGTAGSASSDVITVQGIAAMTALKVDGSGVTQPVSGTFFQATQPVSGTFWQATQPVSGTVSSSQSGTWTVQPGNTANTTAWKVDGSAVTQPVSGTVSANASQTGTWTVQPGNTANTTAWKVDGSAVTQPISNSNLDVALSTRLKPADTLAGVTTVTTVSAVTAITNALPAGTNRVGSFRPVDSADADLTAAKGSQTSRALGTQDLKDSGRTQLRFYFNNVASGTTGTETAITMTKSSGTAATSTGTSFTPTSGKRFRITQIIFGSRGNATATAQITDCRIRVNTAGAVITSSTPIIYDLATATPATASAWDRVTIAGNEGDELLGDGTMQFGVTCASTFTTNAPTWFGAISGYEY